MRARKARGTERLTKNYLRLQQFCFGYRVFIRKRAGNHSLSWDFIGVAIEVKHFDQYVIRKDILGRVTFRNQQFLKKSEKIQAFQLSSPPNDGPTDENEL